jgi:serine/threonine protein kinase
MAQVDGIDYMQQYATHLFGDVGRGPSAAADRSEDAQHQPQRNECMVALLQYYRMCVDLLKDAARLGAAGSGEQPLFEPPYVRLWVQSLSFLVDLNGYAPRHFACVPAASWAADEFMVTDTLVLFMQRLIGLEDSPLHSSANIDLYISSHYLSFLKYYSGQLQSHESAEHMCNAHLKMLLAFAAKKNAVTTRKFYQLQIMHFLVREMSQLHVGSESSGALDVDHGTTALSAAAPKSPVTLSGLGNNCGIPKLPLPEMVVMPKEPPIGMMAGADTATDSDSEGRYSDESDDDTFMTIPPSIMQSSSGAIKPFAPLVLKGVPSIAALKGVPSIAKSIAPLSLQSVVQPLPLQTIVQPIMTLDEEQELDESKLDECDSDLDESYASDSDMFIPIPPAFNPSGAKPTAVPLFSLSLPLPVPSLSLALPTTQEPEESESKECEPDDDLDAIPVSKLAQCTEMHAHAVLLVLALAISNDQAALEPLYVCSNDGGRDQSRVLHSFGSNIFFHLHRHLNSPKQARVLEVVAQRVGEYGAGVERLFKLLSISQFCTNRYANRSLIARGAYGIVYGFDYCSSKGGGGAGDVQGGGAGDVRPVAAKLMSVPQDHHHRCTLDEVYSEITILDQLRESAHVCRLLDYGVSDESYWIVLEHAAMNLKQWRRQDAPPLSPETFPMFIRVFTHIVRAVKFLHDNGVCHYDIKSDNILLRRRPDGAEASHPASDIFCFTDFGVSLLTPGSHARDTFAKRSRGTELIKSPEMLLMAGSQTILGSQIDRRCRQGTNCASDVWSLGCLLFELLAGEFLFEDEDWVQFYYRITSNEQDLIPASKLVLVEGVKAAEDLVRYILVRKPGHRPSVEDILKKLESV